MRLGFVLSLLLILCCPALGFAQSPDVDVSVPEFVEKGQPFFVRVASSEPLKEVRVRWLDKEVAPPVTAADGGWSAVALLGVSLAEKKDVAKLVVEAERAQGVRVLEKDLEVRERKYPEEHLKVAREFVEVSEKDMERHKRERVEIHKVLDSVSPLPGWQCPFVRPVPGSVTSAFGLRRFFNGEPRRPHGGLDLRGGKGDPVKACAPGRVALTGAHFFAGNSVYIDHGQGVVSMYVHLSKIRVKQGQEVAAGQVIGLVGATGRVTAPHLHFGVCVLGTVVDPAPLLAKSATK